MFTIAGCLGLGLGLGLDLVSGWLRIDTNFGCQRHTAGYDRLV